MYVRAQRTNVESGCVKEGLSSACHTTLSRRDIWFLREYPTNAAPWFLDGEETIVTDPFSGETVTYRHWIEIDANGNWERKTE